MKDGFTYIHLECQDDDFGNIKNVESKMSDSCFERNFVTHIYIYTYTSYLYSHSKKCHSFDLVENDDSCQAPSESVG